MARNTPEGRFKEELNKQLMQRFPGCYILINDSGHHPGYPDRTILWGDRWAMLEAKKSHSAAQQANQEYYVELFNKKSFAAFINPDNMEEVLDAMERSFSTPR